MKKKCGSHFSPADTLLDEIKFIVKSNYFGCSSYCNNFYENKWNCSDIDLVDNDIDELIPNDFVIWHESDDVSEDIYDPYDSYDLCDPYQM